MATRLAATSFRSLSRRLLSTSSSSAATPTLLGYFHQPGSMSCLADLESPTHRPARTAPYFAPLSASSPRLSLDFLPVNTSTFSLFDSHQGLLLMLQRDEIPLLVFDPVSRRHALLPPPPRSFVAEASQFLAAALVSRADSGPLDSDAICFTAVAGRLRAWVASFREGECRWRELPQAREVSIDFHPYWFEQRCVHAAGSLYWHVCNYHSALALNASTMEFSFVRAPDLILGEHPFAKFRFGEGPYDGRLCVGALEWERLWLCVRGTGSRDGWVLDREMCLRQVLNSVPGLPQDPTGRTRCICLADIDPGRTGKVFIWTRKFGDFAYHMDTGTLNRLVTDDGLPYGRKIFAYFSAPGSGTDY